jgi:hypothetical protein
MKCFLFTRRRFIGDGPIDGLVFIAVGQSFSSAAAHRAGRFTLEAGELPMVHCLVPLVALGLGHINVVRCGRLVCCAYRLELHVMKSH